MTTTFNSHYESGSDEVLPPQEMERQLAALLARVGELEVRVVAIENLKTREDTAGEVGSGEPLRGESCVKDGEMRTATRRFNADDINRGPKRVFGRAAGRSMWAPKNYCDLDQGYLAWLCYEASPSDRTFHLRRLEETHGFHLNPTQYDVSVNELLVNIARGAHEIYTAGQWKDFIIANKAYDTVVTFTSTGRARPCLKKFLRSDDRVSYNPFPEGKPVEYAVPLVEADPAEPQLDEPMSDCDSEEEFYMEMTGVTPEELHCDWSKYWQQYDEKKPPVGRASGFGVMPALRPMGGMAPEAAIPELEDAMNDMRTANWPYMRTIDSKSAWQNQLLVQLKGGFLPVSLPAAQSFVAVMEESNPRCVSMLLTENHFAKRLDDSAVSYVEVDIRDLAGVTKKLYADALIFGTEFGVSVLQYCFSYSNLKLVTAEKMYLTLDYGITILGDSYNLALMLLVLGARDFCISTGVLNQARSTDLYPGISAASEIDLKLGVQSIDKKHPFIAVMPSKDEMGAINNAAQRWQRNPLTEITAGFYGYIRADCYFVSGLYPAYLSSWAYNAATAVNVPDVPSMIAKAPDVSSWSLVNKITEINAIIAAVEQALNDDPNKKNVVFALSSYVKVLKAQSGKLPPFTNVANGVLAYLKAKGAKGQPKYVVSEYVPFREPFKNTDNGQWPVPDTWALLLYFLGKQEPQEKWSAKNMLDNLRKLNGSGPGVNDLPSVSQLGVMFTLLTNIGITPADVPKGASARIGEFKEAASSFLKKVANDVAPKAPEWLAPIQARFLELEQYVVQHPADKHPGIQVVEGRRTAKARTKMSLLAGLGGGERAEGRGRVQEPKVVARSQSEQARGGEFGNLLRGLGERSGGKDEGFDFSYSDPNA